MKRQVNRWASWRSLSAFHGLRLDRNIERRDALVEDDQLRVQGDAGTLALPPENS